MDGARAHVKFLGGFWSNLAFKQGYEGKEAFWKHVVKTFYEYHDEGTMTGAGG